VTHQPENPNDHRPRGPGLLRVDSERLPRSPLITFLRWWLPAIVCLAGIAIAVISGFTDGGLEAMAGFLGAGSSIWLINFLWRLGVSGDEERAREDAARDYLAAHGHWPDEPGPHGS
jgi:hypothetical protein